MEWSAEAEGPGHEALRDEVSNLSSHNRNIPTRATRFRHQTVTDQRVDERANSGQNGPMSSRLASHAGETPRACAAILLAAGAGTRFRGKNHKLLTNIEISDENGIRTIFEHALAHALEAAIGPVIVVTFCHNEQWAEGQSTSVQAGIDVARDLGCNRVVFGLADQPFISPDAWRKVAAGPGSITVATYQGLRRNPVAVDASVWPLLPTEGDEGARTLMQVRPDLVREVACLGSPADIDTEEDLRRWQNN